MAEIEFWMCKEMGKLGIDASEENARYILGIETAEELEEYMLELLDGTDRKTQNFIKELLVRWRPYNNSKMNNDMQVYQKSFGDDSYVVGKGKKKNSTKQTDRKSPLKNNTLNGNELMVHNRGLMPGDEKPQKQSFTKQSTQEKDVKKKSKFVPLFSKEGQARDVIQLQGRHTCECQAAKHKLISNCTKCGRVVCEQEGSGPCLFCGNLVCTREESDILSRGSKKSEKLRQYLMKDTPTDLLNTTMFNGDRDYLPNTNAKVKDGYKKAEKHKEKLLEFDKSSARRTLVIDDEADYFSVDSKWLSKGDREALKKREEELRSERHASRKDRKITLDFAGRRVVEETTANVDVYNVNDEVVQRVHYGAKPKVKDTAYHSTTTDNSYLVNPNIVQPAPQFIPQNPKIKHSKGAVERPSEQRCVARIQDRELQQMSDEGMCISMHQPWASLLTHAIKIHEGRTWYTTHRGRLWIAATAKNPEPEEIADVEQTYRYLYKNMELEFPSHYPVGCLLGCVDVVDCLAQDTYREKFPEGESASPFVFICDSPQELLVKFPIKGKHKLYKLEGHIHKAAKKGLR